MDPAKVSGCDRLATPDSAGPAEVFWALPIFMAIYEFQN